LLVAILILYFLMHFCRSSLDDHIGNVESGINNLRELLSSDQDFNVDNETLLGVSSLDCYKFVRYLIIIVSLLYTNKHWFSGLYFSFLMNTRCLEWKVLRIRILKLVRSNNLICP